MKIRSVAGPEDMAAGRDTFIAVDEMERQLGSCQVERVLLGEMMPDRPCEVRIGAEGRKKAMPQLLGTALARAMVLAKESRLSARVYAECAPEDRESLERYRSIGLIDDDALVRMRRPVADGPSVARLPVGCVLLEDDLSDPQERTFFLQRQEKLFMRPQAAAWLDDLSGNQLMRRFLLVTREGLAAELLCWAENGEGVVGVVYTAPAWRRRGAATFLMDAARRYFYRNRLKEAALDVRLRMTAAMYLASAAGYRQSEVLTRLPGMNLDAPLWKARH